MMNIKNRLAIVAGGFLAAGGLFLSATGSQGNGGRPVELPHAEGRIFENLDSYLAHLQQLGTIGIAWYEEMPDGRYQLIRRRSPGQEPEIYSREELLAIFGFDR